MREWGWVSGWSGGVCGALLVWFASGQGVAGQVRLRGEVIDTARAIHAFRHTANASDKLDSALQSRRAVLSSNATFIVQFTGPVQPGQVAQLSQAGVHVLGYIPENALLIRADPAALAPLSALAFVQWVGEYQSSHKLHPEIRDLVKRGVSTVRTQSLSRARAFALPVPSTNGSPSRASDYPVPPDHEDPRMMTIVLFDAADQHAVARRVGQLGGAVVTSSAGHGRGLLRVRLAPAAAMSLADLTSVRWIEPYREAKLLNNVAAQGPRMNVDIVRSNYFLTGSNQIVAVCDTGLDIGMTNGIHPDFSNKVHCAIARGRPGDWSDFNGHGTHVCGSAVGSGMAYGNGLYRGIACDARLVIQSVMDIDGNLSGLPADLNDLFLEAYTNDARVHSDSWGSAVDGAYDTAARSVDEFLWEHPDMVICFAAGNEGADSLPTGAPDGVVDEDSLNSPGTAKNAITVGAAESARSNGGYSTHTWSAFGFTAMPLSNDLVSSSSDGLHQGMAPFSSRGPCDDGRVKPDLVAPGTDIISARSRGGISGDGWGVVTGTTNYMYEGGTSMATPLTAGAAALVRQYLSERRGFTNPPGALIKAMMLNAARSLAPGQYGSGSGREIPDQARPNNVEGWGHVNLGETLYPGDGRTNALYTGQVATGGTDTYFFVSAYTNTLSVVLAWYDYPGELAAARALVNDLDLRVTPLGGITHVGNGVPDGDRVNTVEGVDLFPLTPGTTVVQVIGYNIPEGTNQPYALAIRENPQQYSFTLQRAIHSPEWPTNNQPVVLETYVQAGGGGVSGVTNYYRTNGGAWVEAPAAAYAGYGPGVVYTHHLPGQPIGTRVDYFAVAADAFNASYASATGSFVVADVVAYVSTNASPLPPYNTWATAATNINDAVDAVVPGGTVWVTNGTFNGGVVIRKSCTVRSVNGAAFTVIDGHGTSRCVKMDGVVASVLDGFTLTRGVTPNGSTLGDKAGGGVLLREYAMVRNCIISNNCGQYGGGAACYNSKFRYEAGCLSNCLIVGNSADTYYGGGVRLAYGGTLSHCVIRGNTGFGSAGGVYFEGIGGYMDNCLVCGNQATNCSPYEPVAFGTGGGVETYGGGYIVNCTVVSNASVYRGGINFISMGHMMNTIVWSNRQEAGAYDADDDVLHANMVVRSDYSCALGLTNHLQAAYGNITNDPRFADFGGGNYRLMANSPCRDAGATDFWEELFGESQYRTLVLDTDLDGTQRVKNGVVDMGSYELDGHDTGAPQLLQLTPPDNSIGVNPVTPLTLTFDETVFAGAGLIRVVQGDGTTVQSYAAASAPVAVAGGTVTVTLTNPLDCSQDYSVLIESNAFRDASTNWFPGISATGQWNFTTRAAGLTVTNILRVDFGLTNAPVETDGNWQGFGVAYGASSRATNYSFTVGTSTVTVAVSGPGMSGRDRGTPVDGGELTYAEMYRDLIQNSSGGLTAMVAGVESQSPVSLRVWMYDYSFADGVTFTLRDVTDGRNTLLGQVVNHAGAMAKPTNNTMYAVLAAVTTGTNGTLALQITGDSGPARLNGIELLLFGSAPIATNTLAVASALGRSDPPEGMHVYPVGTPVTCVVTGSPFMCGSTQFVCTGWTGSGDVPASGLFTAVSFTVSMDSSISWNWSTNLPPAAISNLPVDSTFAPAVGNRILDMAVDPQGRIVIVGSFTNIGVHARQEIARLLTDGTVDPSMTNGAAHGDHDWALSVMCHANGHTYVGGSMNGELGNFARFLADGRHDTSFPPEGIAVAADNMVESQVPLADGGILIGGGFTAVMDHDHGGLARLDASGGVVSTFNATLDNLMGGWTSVDALAEQADGRLVIGGDFPTLDGVLHRSLGRLHPDGSLDTTFTNQITSAEALVKCLLVQTNGLLAGGVFSAVGGLPATNLVRFRADDTVDTSFAVGPNGVVNALLALPDGRILMGGGFSEVNGAPHPGLALLRADGSVDASFTMGVSGLVAGVVYALQFDRNGDILVAGEFDYLGSLARQNIGRLVLGSSSSGSATNRGSTGCEYWAGVNKDGHARNASAVSLQGGLRVGWARALTNFSPCTVNERASYGGQRGNTIAVHEGRILAVVPNTTNDLGAASSSRFASFGTFALRDGARIHETLTSHLGGGSRGGATLQDSDTAYGLVNFYWNTNDVVYTGYGSDAARSYAFDAFTGTLPVGAPFTPVALAPNASGYFAMTYDNPLLFARGARNTHGSFSNGRAGLLGLSDSSITSMKHYAPFLVSGWDVIAYTMASYTEDASFPSGLGTLMTDYRFTNSPYGVTTRWQLSNPSNTFAGFGLHHVRGAPRPIALGEDGRIYYYGFRNTVSGSTPVSADYAAGMRLFAVSAGSGTPLFEINTGWNPAGDPGLASSVWGSQLYHHFLPQIAVASNHVVVFHPQVNQGGGSAVWTRGRLFCFDTATTSLLWSVTYSNNSFAARLCLDDVVYNPSNNTSPNSMWADNTEQAVQMTVAGDSAYLVDPSIVGGAATGALQLAVYKYALDTGAATSTNLVPHDDHGGTITAVAERSVNANDNTNRVALRELAAVDGRLVALVDIDLTAQALVVIEGSEPPPTHYRPVAAIMSPASGVPPALQSFNDSRLTDTAPAYGVPVLGRAGRPLIRLYDTGTAVTFDAGGSADPNGGSLSCGWDFGDGLSGAGSVVSHQYASWGGIPAISNMTVRLAVVDSSAQTATVSRVVQIRDAGATTVTTLTASADSYVYTAGSSSNSNFGASQNLEVRCIDAAGLTQEVAYVKFDLSGVDVSAVADAVLRVLVTTPKEFLLEAYVVSNTWSESSLRGSNAPLPGVRVGDAVATQYDEVGSYTRAFYQWLEFPVTLPVREAALGTERSFAITTTNSSASALLMASRNNTTVSGSAPQLVLRMGVPAIPAPVVTAAPSLYIVYTNSTTQSFSVVASSPVGTSNLTYNWVQMSGPRRAVLATRHAVGSGDTQVIIPSGGGTYQFRCLIDDGLQAAVQDVTLQESPLASYTLVVVPDHADWGSVTPTGGVFAAGSNVVLTASANRFYRFTDWSGDRHGTFNPLLVSVTGDTHVVAGFDEVLVTNGVPQAWLAGFGLATNDAGALGDADGDGMPAWEEYIAGTTPTQGGSCLEITGAWQAPAGSVLSWPPSSGRVYAVQWRSNSLAGEWVPLPGSGWGIYTDVLHHVDRAGFYRLSVRQAP